MVFDFLKNDKLSVNTVNREIRVEFVPTLFMLRSCVG